jgi:hypothetical protein
LGVHPVVWKKSGTGPLSGDGENNHLPTLPKGVNMVDKKKPSATDVDESSEISLGKLFDSYVPDTVKRANQHASNKAQINCFWFLSSGIKIG